MKTFFPALIITILSFFACNPGPDYWPTEGWRTATPESQGMDSETLSKMLLEIDLYDHPIDYVSVTRNGYIVMEAEQYPYTKEHKTILHSASKSFTSAMVGRALQEGILESLDRSALEFFPEYSDISDRDAKGAITIRDLLLMAPGIQWDEHAVPYDSPDNIINQAYRSNDSLRFFWELPLVNEPGTHYTYNGQSTVSLAEIVSRAGNQEPQEQWQEFLLEPMGIQDSFLWTENGVPGGAAGGLFLQPWDFAKLGFLYLNQGRWEDKQLIPEDYIQESIQAHEYENVGPQGINGLDDYYGYQWWVFDQGYYSAQGLGGQYLFIWPEKDLIATFISRLDITNIKRPIQFFKRFVVPAVLEDGPLPENPRGLSKLDNLAQSLRERPSPQPIAIPPQALEISGKYFDLAENTWELDGLMLEFQQDQAWVTLERTDQTEAQRLEIGLDGIFRETFLPEQEGSRDFDETWQLRGQWRDEATFDLELRIPSDRYDVRQLFQFQGENLILRVEPSGAFNLAEEILGTRRQD